MPQLAQNYSGYKVVDFQGVAFDNATDDKYFTALLAGDIRVQFDMRIHSQDFTQAEIFYQAVLTNAVRSTEYTVEPTEPDRPLITLPSDVIGSASAVSGGTSTCTVVNLE